MSSSIEEDGAFARSLSDDELRRQISALDQRRVILASEQRRRELAAAPFHEGEEIEVRLRLDGRWQRAKVAVASARGGWISYRVVLPRADGSWGRRLRHVLPSEMRKLPDPLPPDLRSAAEGDA